MSGKRRHADLGAKRQALLEQARIEALARGVAVDLEALAPNSSYSQPDFATRGYYADLPFVCQGCGVQQVWTAAQQKWWYEVAKGDVWTTASLCRDCRKRKRAAEARPRGGDPNPYKNPGLLLAKIRTDVEPRLMAAGFRPAGRSKPNAGRDHFLEYSRSGDLLMISWDQHKARLAADLLTAGGDDLRLIAAVVFSGARSTEDIEILLAPFLDSVRSLDDLGPAPPGTD